MVEASSSGGPPAVGPAAASDVALSGHPRPLGGGVTAPSHSSGCRSRGWGLLGCSRWAAAFPSACWEAPGRPVGGRLLGPRLQAGPAPVPATSCVPSTLWSFSGFPGRGAGLRSQHLSSRSPQGAAGEFNQLLTDKNNLAARRLGAQRSGLMTACGVPGLCLCIFRPERWPAATLSPEGAAKKQILQLGGRERRPLRLLDPC